jgi:hypothetical protein
MLYLFSLRTCMKVGEDVKVSGLVPLEERVALHVRLVLIGPSYRQVGPFIRAGIGERIGHVSAERKYQLSSGSFIDSDFRVY